MEDQKFRELFQQIAESYTLAPELAEELLQRILAVLRFCNFHNEKS